MFDKNLLKGIIAPMVNPCFEDDTLDMDGVKANLQRLLDSDVAGLYINGGTGDAANLTQQERLDIAAYLVPELLKAGKTAIVHVGQTTQRCAVELAEQAVRLGAHAVASIPPKKPWPQIVEYYKALAATDEVTALRTNDALTCKYIFDSAKAGDGLALQVLDQFYRYMGEFLGNLCDVVDPDAVVLGGGVSKAGQVLLDGIRPYFDLYVFHAARGARFELASLGNDAGAYGAFKLALDSFGN